MASYFSSDGLWIVGVGVATNVACAMLGCLLVLRRMSMMGDALSHAVLPGLAVAFILSGSFNILPLFLGAVVAGLLTTFLTQTLHQYARVPSDASMGAAFTSLFAIGVILIKRNLDGVHFDVECVYEGELLFVPDHLIAVAGWELPRAALTIGPVLLLNTLVLALLWKELKLAAFDPALATTMGFSAAALHYLLMALVSITTVASFEAVGSILVVAMLIVPAATAHLLCDRLITMVATAAGLAAAAAVTGYVLAMSLNVNVAGMTAVVTGLFYAVAVLFAPHYGVLSKLWSNARVSIRVVREDLLAMLYRVEELGGAKQLSTSEAGRAVGVPWQARWALAHLVREGQVRRTDERLALTDAGREAARQLVRTHRLWETYLVEFLGMPLDHVHEPAHRVEHYLGQQLQEKLAEELDSTGRDPHGREIPE